MSVIGYNITKNIAAMFANENMKKLRLPIAVYVTKYVTVCVIDRAVSKYEEGTLLYDDGTMVFFLAVIAYGVYYIIGCIVEAVQILRTKINITISINNDDAIRRSSFSSDACGGCTSTEVSSNATNSTISESLLRRSRRHQKSSSINTNNDDDNERHEQQQQLRPSGMRKSISWEDLTSVDDDKLINSVVSINKKCSRYSSSSRNDDRKSNNR